MLKIQVDEKSLPALAGTQDSHLKYLEAHFDVEIAARGREITVRGDPTREAMVAELLAQLGTHVSAGNPLSSQDVSYAARLIAEEGSASLARLIPEQVSNLVV